MEAKKLELPISGSDANDRVLKGKYLAIMSKHLTAAQLAKLCQAAKDPQKVKMAMNFL